MEQSAVSLLSDLKELGNPEKAKVSAWFFKTGPGQYAEGDRFLGVSVPDQRKIAKRYARLPLPEIKKLLYSPLHESRLTALLILVGRYKKGSPQERDRIVAFYLKHRQQVNNWDLVDSSAPHILGQSLLHQKDRSILYRLARSESLWDRRISIIATQALIRDGRYQETLDIAEQLLDDPHDLIHKAAGWMLREVGKRCLETEERFLKQHAAVMPRTMLRYALEKFPEEKRKTYLASKEMGRRNPI